MMRFERMRLRVLLFLGLVLLSPLVLAHRRAPAPAPQFATWSEDATRDYFNRQLKYRWVKALGDYENKPIAHLRIAETKDRQILHIPVYGRDFLLIGRPGAVVRFHSRESPDVAARPVLKIGNRIYAATRDTVLDSSTSKPQGHLPLLHSGGNILIAFDDAPENKTGELILTSDQQNGREDIYIYRPTPTWARTAVPLWLQGPNRTVLRVDGRVMEGQPQVRVQNGIATASLFAPRRTWMSKLLAMPPMESACLTIYMKFHSDFAPGNGGKLPGFANTGMHRLDSQMPEKIAGRSFANSGWGGRRPDGVHWSARTGFGAWTQKNVEVHSYFYALEPFQGSGVMDPIGRSLPRGKWTAYVSCMHLNRPGKADGRLFYQIVGQPPSYARNDILWRTEDAPQSHIREIWLDFYCGGSSCNSAAAGTISFAGAELSTSLPDMTQVAAYVSALERRAPD